MRLLNINFLLGLFLSFSLCNAAPDKRPIIAVTQIAPHPSLDRIRQGITDELNMQMIDVDIRFDQASGDISIATQLAQKFVALNPAVIVPISTPSAQTVYQQARLKNIPVVFAAVSDPVAAKLIEGKTKTGKGITGVSDLSPVSQQVQLIKTLQPALKKLGTLHNPGETNSTILVELIKQEALKNNIEVIIIPCPSSKDVAQGIKKLMTEVDAVYIPNDNTIVSALDTVIRTASKTLPIYAADPESVGRGCLASAAYSQYEIGRATGKIVARVLSGTAPEEITVTTPETVEVTVNRDVATRLGIKIPASFSQQKITYIGA